MKNKAFALKFFFSPTFQSGLVLLLLSFCISTTKAQNVPKKPNIIVILTDDMGYADVGIHGVEKDVRTPNLDALAKSGVRMTNGYVTAPQCVPSRAGLITGRYQTRFNLEMNGQGPMKPEEITLAERLKTAGYTTGFSGKWHLESGREEEQAAARNRDTANAPPKLIPNRGIYMPYNQGFDEYLVGAMTRYAASHTLDGKKLDNAPQTINNKAFRVDVQAEWAVSFVDRNADKPFFLYLPFFAPHVPLEATEKYLSRFPDATKERRMALAMVSAVDDGIGQLVKKLTEKGILENTLIVFLSDNGAPLHKNAWNGSLNTSLLGEKGMLTEGGIHIPFIMSWKGTLPAGKVYEKPIISLDIAATAIEMAGLKPDKALDGVNLMPFLLDKTTKVRTMSCTGVGEAKRQSEWTIGNW
jgi:arylsulfatase A-like enzyme